MMFKSEADVSCERFLRQYPAGADDNSALSFYTKVSEELRFSEALEGRKIVFMVVAHFVHTLPPFLAALAEFGPIGAIISKGSHCVPEVMDGIRELYKTLIFPDINKSILANNREASEKFIRHLLSLSDWSRYQWVIIDHGGYFAPRLDSLSLFEDRLLGVIEHTWNGELRYRDHEASSRYPILSIARAKVKQLEDGTVASSVVSALRGRVFTAAGLNADLRRLEKVAVIGYGHIGSSVARELRAEVDPGRIWICDLSQEKQKEARLWFSHVVEKIEDALVDADLVIFASSRPVLTRVLARSLKAGSCLVCVTSSDDQFEADALEDYRQKKPLNASAPITTYQGEGDKEVHLVANGGGANFIIGSTAHPILQAVFALVLDGVRQLLKGGGLAKKVLPVEVENHEAVLTFWEGIYGSLKRHDDVERYVWNLPLAAKAFVSTYFTGRRDELKQLGSGVTDKEISQQVIVGSGGVGKSTLSLKYVLEQVPRYYDYAIWFEANNLVPNFTALAEFLGIESKGSVAYLTRRVYAALNRYQKLLIIFDDAASYATLLESRYGSERVSFLPDSDQKQIHWIATTRNTAFFSLNPGKIVRLNSFSLDEAMIYIQARVPSENAVAKDFFTVLHGFPLAISQALSYAEKLKISLSDYLRLYEQSALNQRSFLSKQAGDRDPYVEAVYTTWLTSIKALMKESTMVMPIIITMAFLAESKIPLTLLKQAFSKFNELDLLEALSLLEQYSLILSEITVVDRVYSLHQLLQKVVRLHLFSDPDPALKYYPPVRSGKSDNLYVEWVFYLISTVFDLSRYFLTSSPSHIRREDVATLNQLENHLYSFIHIVLYDDKSLNFVQVLLKPLIRLICQFVNYTGFENGEYKTSINQLEYALRFIREQGEQNNADQCVVLSTLGRVYADRYDHFSDEQDLMAAIRYYQDYQVIESAEGEEWRVGNRHSLARMYILQAMRNRSDKEEKITLAEGLLKDALSFRKSRVDYLKDLVDKGAKEKNNELMDAMRRLENSYVEKALCLGLRGEFILAGEAIEKGLSLADRLPETMKNLELSWCHQRWGHIQVMQGSFIEAKDSYRKAFNYFDQARTERLHPRQGILIVDLLKLCVEHPEVVSGEDEMRSILSLAEDAKKRIENFNRPTEVSLFQVAAIKTLVQKLRDRYGLAPDVSSAASALVGSSSTLFALPGASDQPQAVESGGLQKRASPF